MTDFSNTAPTRAREAINGETRHNPSSVTPGRKSPRLPRIAGSAENGQTHIKVECEEAHATNLGLGDVAAPFAEYILSQLINLTVSGVPPDGPLDMRDANALLQLAAAAQPQDELEAALAAQLAMLHHLALDAGRRAMSKGATLEGRALNVSQAGKLSRSYAMLLDALARHRGKVISQTVRVEHVTIHGGQNIVGAVGGGAARKSEVRAHGQAEPRHAGSAGVAALPCPEPGGQAMCEAGEQGPQTLPLARRRGGKRRAAGQHK